MHQIRQLLQLHLQGYSIHQLTARLGIARNTVRHYLRRLQASGQPLDRLLQSEDAYLDTVVNPPQPLAQSSRQVWLLEQMPTIHQQVVAGITLYQLWLEYREQQPDGFQYTQFRVHYRKWRQHLEASLHLEHQAGDKLFVDFAGKKLHLTDLATGKQTPVEVFVAILGHSQLTYVQAVPSQKTADFLLALEGALRFMGGAPQAVVPDNLKSAVNRAHRYEPEMNPTLADFALHYNTSILPTRAGKPKDKPLVEGAVNLVYQRVYARLRYRQFATLAELNEAIQEQVEVHNQTRFQRQSYTRRDVFEDYERAVLQALPTTAFVLRRYRQLTVQKNCHVLLADDNCYYSVPYKLIGQRVQVAYTTQTVEVYHNYQRVSAHQRPTGRSRYATTKQHLPPAHRHVLDWTPDYFREWAARVGPQALAAVEHLLATGKHPEAAHRSCLGILRLEKKVGAERLERACGRALHYNSVSYSVISNILSRGLDAQTETAATPTVTVVHDNIRGAAAYQ